MKYVDLSSNRLKICKKLYGDVISVSKVGLNKNSNRRYFYIKFSNGKKIQKRYYRYLKEKEVGHKLSKIYHVHHIDTNSSNDLKFNLKIKKNGKHMSDHMTGKNHPLYGKHHNSNTKRKISSAKLGKSNPKLSKFYLKLRMKKNEELAKKFGQPWT
jgi:hypothetical protein